MKTLGRASQQTSTPKILTPHLQLGALRVEQIPDVLLIDLEVGHPHQELPFGRLVHQTEQVTGGHLHDSRSLIVVPALHCEGLARRRLPVRENSAIQAAHDGVHYLARDALVDLLRGAVLVEDAVVGEERTALCIGKWVPVCRCLSIIHE